MFWADSKGTVFSPGVQAMGCLVVESILLETLAFCNSSNTERNSLSFVENTFSSIGEKPESFFNWEELVEIIGGVDLLRSPLLLYSSSKSWEYIFFRSIFSKLRLYFFQVNLIIGDINLTKVKIHDNKPKDLRIFYTSASIF